MGGNFTKYCLPSLRQDFECNGALAHCLQKKSASAYQIKVSFLCMYKKNTIFAA